MSDFHDIEKDLAEMNSRPTWEWKTIPKGIKQLEALLAAHAEFQRLYPERANEADH